MNKPCYCGSSLTFNECCQIIINQEKLADSAEQLMRSRFCAFLTQNESWLFKSWATKTRPKTIDFDPDLKWLDLSILNTADHDGSHSTVEFEARYLKKGKVSAIRENSRFIKHMGQWFYVDGDFLKTTFKPFKPSRNEPCPCGSLKKFKKCCSL